MERLLPSRIYNVFEYGFFSSSLSPWGRYVFLACSQSLCVCAVFYILGFLLFVYLLPLKLFFLILFFSPNNQKLTVVELSVSFWFQSVPLFQGSCSHPVSTSQAILITDHRKSYKEQVLDTTVSYEALLTLGITEHHCSQ